MKNLLPFSLHYTFRLNRRALCAAYRFMGGTRNRRRRSSSASTRCYELWANTLRSLCVQHSNNETVQYGWAVCSYLEICLLIYDSAFTFTTNTHSRFMFGYSVDCLLKSSYQEVGLRGLVTVSRVSDHRNVHTNPHQLKYISNLDQRDSEVTLNRWP